MGRIGSPSAALVGGTSSRGIILEDYVFDAGIHDEEISNILSYKYPQYYMTALLDRIGASETVSETVFSWYVMDRTRKSGTVTNILNGAGGAFVADTSTDARIEVPEFVYASGSLGYALVGDVFRTEGGANFLVSAVGQGATDTDAQLLTIAKQGGGTISAAELANTMVIGHVFNSFGEGSDAPDGRVYLPTEEFNYTHILRRSFEISGTEFTNKSIIGKGPAWYFEQENIEMKEFARDKEGVVMFGKKVGTSGAKATRGIFDYVNTDGQHALYSKATGVTESDFQDMLEILLVEGSSDTLLALCGAKFLAEANATLKDYHISGSINYGNWMGVDIGLDVQSYRFLGKTIDFVHYALFNDSSMVPFSGTPDAAKIDFSSLALLLDMGTDDNGKKLISLKYKELAGQSRKFIHAYETGMMSPEGQNGGHVSNGKDAFKVHYLCEIGVELRLANRMGVMRSNAA